MGDTTVKSATTTTANDGFQLTLEGGYNQLTVEEGVKGDSTARGLQIAGGVGYQGHIKQVGPVHFKWAVEGLFGYNGGGNPIDSHTPAGQSGGDTTTEGKGKCRDIMGTPTCPDDNNDNYSPASTNGAYVEKANSNHYAFTLRPMVGAGFFNDHLNVFVGPEVRQLWFTDNATFPVDGMNGTIPLMSNDLGDTLVGGHAEVEFRPHNNIGISLGASYLPLGGSTAITSVASAPEEAGGTGEEGALYYMPVGLDAMSIGAAVTFYPSGKVAPLNIHISNPFKKKPKEDKEATAPAPATSAPASTVSKYAGMTPAQEVAVRLTDAGINIVDQDIAALTDADDGTITIAYTDGTNMPGNSKEDVLALFGITVTEEPAPVNSAPVGTAPAKTAKQKKILGIFPRKEKTVTPADDTAEKKTFWQKLGLGKKKPVAEASAPQVANAPVVSADPVEKVVVATPTDMTSGAMNNPAYPTVLLTPADPVPTEPAATDSEASLVVFDPWAEPTLTPDAADPAVPATPSSATPAADPAPAPAENPAPVTAPAAKPAAAVRITPKSTATPTPGGAEIGATSLPGNTDALGNAPQAEGIGEIIVITPEQRSKYAAVGAFTSNVADVVSTFPMENVTTASGQTVSGTYYVNETTGAQWFIDSAGTRHEISYASAQEVDFDTP